MCYAVSISEKAWLFILQWACLKYGVWNIKYFICMYSGFYGTRLGLVQRSHLLSPAFKPTKPVLTLRSDLEIWTQAMTWNCSYKKMKLDLWSDVYTRWHQDIICICGTMTRIRAAQLRYRGSITGSSKRLCYFSKSSDWMGSSYSPICVYWRLFPPRIHRILMPVYR